MTGSIFILESYLVSLCIVVVLSQEGEYCRLHSCGGEKDIQAAGNRLKEGNSHFIMLAP